MSRTVAVIGGGYGGSAVAKALDAETDVVLIEPKDAFVHAAGSLRALVRPEWAGNIFFPYDRLLRRGRIVRDRAVSVDPEGVTLASGGHVAADYLVLASGSGYPYPAKTETDSADEALDRLRVTHKELAGAARVLITGAGPVGLELSGEIKAVWPDKQVTIVDPAEELVPGFAAEMRADLQRQLDALGVDLRLGTALTGEPPVAPGRAETFTVGSTGGEISADIWFRAHGVRVNTGYLRDGLAAALTPQGRVRVTETLTVDGHEHVYALGDITDLAEAKMAGYAMRHAEVIAANILAQVRGERPTAVYRPSPIPAIILPLGPNGGVGQFPSPDGPTLLPTETVAEYKGRDLFTGRFTELFGTT
ncbi:NAD(P)/FAD-dependent oxidoreductase [Actinoallomurus rhizosphaericola]|uniref:NAD(P)/FAD-dependent oxidoreductase n=1 Tax=Actinoallomurus rhizosphaericola TaxID=2952536 RepID=UPI00208FFC06|nr:FAD-dependent oxidoreductase [Actinoallomurus rhizosphaericola]MCO5993326.1 FAD-dependent oxidoreductase [Actinoallomurus rhizosphaericola]